MLMETKLTCGDPYEPTHPGEFLLDEVAYLNLSQRELAQQIGVPYKVFHSILKGKHPVTPELAALFETLGLGWKAKELLHLQADYDRMKATGKFRKKAVKAPFAALRKVAAVFA
ncbi:hypothetical protein AGMMS49982_03440 [Bacteroidia bacterium]|nr:hypothetical protein AGMMS49982_03440 [Bacteroidia bacterium]